GDCGIELDDAINESVERQAAELLLTGGEPVGSEPWSHLEESETAAQRIVENCETAVGGVHHADDVDVGRHGEPLVLVQESKLIPTFVAFDEHEQFAEDLRDIASVDLVDDEEVGTAGIVGSSFFTESIERSFSESESSGFG